MGAQPHGLTQRSAYNSYFQLSFKLWSLGRADNDWVMSTLTGPATVIMYSEVRWGEVRSEVWRCSTPAFSSSSARPWLVCRRRRWPRQVRLRCLNIIDWMFRLIIHPPSLSALTRPVRRKRNIKIIVGVKLHHGVVVQGDLTKIKSQVLRLNMTGRLVVLLSEAIHYFPS